MRGGCFGLIARRFPPWGGNADDEPAKEHEAGINRRHQVIGHDPQPFRQLLELAALTHAWWAGWLEADDGRSEHVNVLMRRTTLW